MLPCHLIALLSLPLSCRIFVVGIGFFSLCFLMTSLGGQFSAKRPGDSPFTVRAEGKPGVPHQCCLVASDCSGCAPALVMNRPGTCWELRGASLIAASGLHRPAHFAHQQCVRGVLSPGETPLFSHLHLPSFFFYTCFHLCSVATWTHF